MLFVGRAAETAERNLRNWFAQMLGVELDELIRAVAVHDIRTVDGRMHLQWALDLQPGAIEAAANTMQTVAAVRQLRAQGATAR